MEWQCSLIRFNYIKWSVKLAFPICIPISKNPYRFIHHRFACWCVKLTWKCCPITKCVFVCSFSIKMCNECNLLAARGNFWIIQTLNSLMLLLSPHHRFSHGSRSPTLIYNPQRGVPHPLPPAMLNACKTWRPTQIIQYLEGLHICLYRRGCFRWVGLSYSIFKSDFLFVVVCFKAERQTCFICTQF